MQLHQLERFFLNYPYYSLYRRHPFWTSHFMYPVQMRAVASIIAVTVVLAITAAIVYYVSRRSRTVQPPMPRTLPVRTRPDYPGSRPNTVDRMGVPIISDRRIRRAAGRRVSQPDTVRNGVRIVPVENGIDLIPLEDTVEIE